MAMAYVSEVRGLWRMSQRLEGYGVCLRGWRAMAYVSVVRGLWRMSQRLEGYGVCLRGWRAMAYVSEVRWLRRMSQRLEGYVCEASGSCLNRAKCESNIAAARRCSRASALSERKIVTTGLGQRQRVLEHLAGNSARTGLGRHPGHPEVEPFAARSILTARWDAVSLVEFVFELGNGREVCSGVDFRVLGEEFSQSCRVCGRVILAEKRPRTSLLSRSTATTESCSVAMRVAYKRV
jgi:hypothetical protein